LTYIYIKNKQFHHFSTTYLKKKKKKWKETSFLTSILLDFHLKTALSKSLFTWINGLLSKSVKETISLSSQSKNSMGYGERIIINYQFKTGDVISEEMSGSHKETRGTANTLDW